MVSAGIGAGVWIGTGSPLAVPVAVGAGVLIDGDHILDFLDWVAAGYKRSVFVLLHAWELAASGVVVLAAFWYHPLLLAAVLGYLSHLVADQIGNPMHPLGYSILYRVRSGFRHSHLVRGPQTLVPEHDIPFGRYMAPWLYRVVARLRTGKAGLTAPEKADYAASQED